MKTCNRCGETKPLDGFYFEKGRPRSNCKDCHKAGVYAKRDEDREGFREYQREWNRRNPGKHAGYEAKRRERNRDAINARNRELWPRYRERNRRWRHENRARVRAVSRAWYWNGGRELLLPLRRSRRATNSAALRAQERRWRAANPEKVSAMNRAYYRKNSHRWELYRSRYEFTEREDYSRREIYDRDGGVCRGCDKQLEYGPHKFQIDHIVPKSLGGPDTRANVQLMCPTCNRAKWANLEGQIHLPV